jgi:hypothetical protein
VAGHGRSSGPLDDTGPRAARVADRMNELVAEKVTFRSRAEVLRFFDGLDLVEPGLVPAPQWRPASDLETASPTVMWAGVGRKS